MKLTAKQHDNIPRYPSLKQMLDWEIGKLNVKHHAKEEKEIVKSYHDAIVVLTLFPEFHDKIINYTGTFYSKRFKK